MKKINDLGNFANDIANLQLRMDGVELRLSRLESLKVELADSVARLERFEIGRRATHKKQNKKTEHAT